MMFSDRGMGILGRVLHQDKTLQLKTTNGIHSEVFGDC